MRLKTIVILLAALFAFRTVSYACSTSGEVGKVDVFDIGQGDAILITTPGKNRILIDGGPDFSVDTYLNREFPPNKCHLDVLVLTHPHADHVAGLNRVLQRCTVGAIFVNEVPYESVGYKRFIDASVDFKVQKLIAGDSFEIDGVSFLTLWPTEELLAKKLNDVNIVSTVLFMDYGNFEALFTGDIEKEVLDELDLSLILPLIDDGFDYYKVPHHGSKYNLSTDLVLQLRPKVAIVSVGEGNRFQHPHSQTLDFLETAGARVFRTDIDGTITVKYGY